MVERRIIGLIYQYNENWIGGTYYIENLIAALNRLTDEQKPGIIIFTEKQEDFDNLIKRIDYPYLSKRQYFKILNLFQRFINKITWRITGKYFFSVFHNDIDLVFPAANENSFKKNQNFLYWIPDFQEHYIPTFFTENEICIRKKYQVELIDWAKYIVFSSRSAKDHFNEIYPQNNVKEFVLPFAVTHPNISGDTDVRKKYGLPEQFFICSNQFWKHKNHQVIVDAIAKLKDEGKDIFVIFTGKEFDSRNPEYFNELKQDVANKGIEKNIFFLGFINREDQLRLMKIARAVIQPSLFEGWSTVIEDAKSLNLRIIASDIDVHREQLVDYGARQFFDPTNEAALTNCLVNVNISMTAPAYNYDSKVIEFAESFQAICKVVYQEKEN